MCIAFVYAFTISWASKLGVVGLGTTLLDERGDGDGVYCASALSMVGCASCCSLVRLSLGAWLLPDEPDWIRASRMLTFFGGAGAVALAFPFPFSMLA